MATITRPARRPKIKSPLDAVRPDQDLLDQIAPDRGNAISQSTFLWNGFLHEWKRRVAGGPTPHRLGGFANYLDDERHTVDNRTWLALADAHFGFAPGIDGDYAFPHMTYGLVHSPDLVVARGRATFRFADHVSGKPPQAETSRTQRLAINLNRPELDRGRRDNYTLILRGWELDVATPGANPQKASMWAYKLRIALEDIRRQSDKLNAALRLDLFRGKSPLPGPGRTLAECLQIAVTVHYTVLGGNDDAFRATPAPTATLSRNIHSGERAVRGDVTGAAGLPVGTMAMTGFGYELLKTKNRKNRGRYMSSLTFGVLDKDYDAATGTMDYKTVMGFKAPKSVFDSSAQYELQPVLLQFSEKAKLIRGAVDAEQTASGTVCVNGLGFSCQNANIVSDRGALPEQTADTVRTTREVPLDRPRAAPKKRRVPRRRKAR